MVRKTIIVAMAASLLFSCGSKPVERGATGGGIGLGTAVLFAANPLLGIAVGAGVGAATTKAQIDLGDAPI